jgi:hypothetical protein
MPEPEKTSEQQENNGANEKHRTNWFIAAWTKQKYETYKAATHRYVKKWFEGPWWFQEKEPVARFTGWVALYTLALACLGGLQTCILSNQLREMRVEQRAWIAPQQIVAPENFQQHKDEDAAIGLRFENTGKEPAFDLNVPIEVDVIEGTQWLDENFLRRKVREMLSNRSCDSFDISPDTQKGRTVFPGAHGSVRKDLNHEKAYRGSTHPGYFVMVVACFIYRTADSVRRSEFCGVLDHPNRSNDDKWQSVFCPVHNSAN